MDKLYTYKFSKEELLQAIKALRYAIENGGIEFDLSLYYKLKYLGDKADITQDICGHKETECIEEDDD